MKKQSTLEVRRKEKEKLDPKNILVKVNKRGY